MTGKTVGHYHILERIGQGGMGEVYLAEDARLDRKIAVKFLPRKASLDAEASFRFRREAKAAAALNHPNIITVHEIDEHEESAYIAMEYIDGQTLREKMNSATAQAAPPTIDEAIDIVSQICDGLSAAHRAGITHRDLKPENIMIAADGRIKILDFGLAKLRGAANLTADTAALGTVNYMSPEQAGGEPVDHRTDIWSLGVLLYEMLTDRLPFKSEYEQAVIYSILNSEPEPVSFLRKDAPRAIDAIANKALAEAVEVNPEALDLYLMALQARAKEELDYEQAIAYFEQSVAIDSGFAPAYAGLAIEYAVKGGLGFSPGVEKQAMRLWETVGFSETGRARYYALTGEPAKALRVIEDWKTRWAQGEAFLLWRIAWVYADLGEREQVMDWLERGYQTRTGLLVYVKVAPQFYSLHGEPRFQALLKKMGFPE